MPSITPGKTKRTLGIEELQKILPQVYPFLLIDRVEDYREEEYLIATKNITGSEWCQEGSSSKALYFPETLIIEAAAQAALVLYHVSRVKEKRHLYYMLGRIISEFNSIVRIGDILFLEAYATKMLYDGGYSDIKIVINNLKIGCVRIFYCVQWNKHNF